MTLPLFPVAILVAGRGTRMTQDGKPGAIHKALMPLGDKAILSHVLESFAPGTRFVMAVGYLAEQVKTYMQLMHPDMDVTFVDVDPYEGPGSGPGQSLLQCAHHLQEPFYAIPADTLFKADITQLAEKNGLRNWVGVSVVADDDTANYTTFAVAPGGEQRVTEIAHKLHKPGWPAWNGFIFVHDFATFWERMRTDHSTRAGEFHHSNGIEALIHSVPGVFAQEMEWEDVGTYKLYNRALHMRGGYDFSKTDEAIYFSKSSVIKMFVDARAAHNRVAKARLNPLVFPEIEVERGQFYSYRFQPGVVFYQAATPPLFQDFLTWCNSNLWKPRPDVAERMPALCDDFYRVKTLGRLKKYQEKYPTDPLPTHVNGLPVGSLAGLLETLDWSRLCQGVPTFMHGDLQFDNILYDAETRAFKLLDWRQDFAGEIEFGDLYYDLAKLYGGTILHYDLIKKNLLRYDAQETAVWLDYPQRASTPACQQVLADFVTAKGLDWSRVKILTALIFLNMAPLHHPPFDKLLYALALRMLTDLAEAPETAAWFRSASPAKA